MSQNKKDQVLDIISGGLLNFVTAMGDKLMLEAGGMFYRGTQDVFVENIEADNACLVAFPSMVILPDDRTEGFVAVLNDKIIVAWRKGFFKKTIYSRVIPKITIRQASWTVSDQPGTRGASLLTIITDDQKIDVGLPKGRPDLAEAILDAVQAK
jgi:hypothetical protein